MKPLAREDQFVETLVRGLPRSARQLNRVHESDAELLRLPGSDIVLAVTVDQIVEEIRAGLYDDPFLLGWMTVISSASDLAAVGAEPLGVVIGQTLPGDTAPAFLEQLQRGLAEAASAARLPVLGGDTAQDGALATASTAFGIVPDGVPLTRRGARAGDRLVATGLLGLGSAFAWAKVQGEKPPLFQPRPRFIEGAAARGRVRAAIDTSDGALAALDLLLRWDALDLDLDAPMETILHPAALQVAAAQGLPPWTLLAGPHGEFELLWAVPPQEIPPLQAEGAAQGFTVLELGTFRSGQGEVRLLKDGLAVDPARVRDLHPLAPRDPRAFLAALRDGAQPRAGAVRRT